MIPHCAFIITVLALILIVARKKCDVRILRTLRRKREREREGGEVLRLTIKIHEIITYSIRGSKPH